MVDLKGQYEKIKAEVDNGIQEVINNAAFIKGAQVKQFEEALAIYLNVKNVISCANGTDALQIAMMVLNLKPGDEIILPAFTYAATAEVICLLGLKPVLIDVERDTYNMDTSLIEEKITGRTKAIVPVHLFGQCVNMDEVTAIAAKHKLYIIEDTAQALGSTYTFKNNTKKRAGCIGTIGTTSFFPSKNLGCFGDGGALLTNDDELAKKIRMVANHGQSSPYIHDYIGVNSRLDTIQAAVLLAKLKQLKSYEKARNEVADMYDRLLGNHPALCLPKRNTQSTHVFNQYTLQIHSKNQELKLNRDELRKKLAEAGIPSMVYYPIPLFHQKAFLNPEIQDNDLPVTFHLCQAVISLPIHTEMNAQMITYIATTLLKIIDA